MNKEASLYRMVTDDHICPFGLRSLHLLKKHGYRVEDHHLTSRQQTDNFKQRHQVETTPQTFIDGERIGGHDALLGYFNESTIKQTGTSYQPVIALFSMAALTTIALWYAGLIGAYFYPLFMTFVATAMLLLSLQKLQDLYSFANSFITYDLLAMRHLRYAYLYPFLEAWVGLGMLAGVNAWLVAPVGIFIGSVGASSVIKAVYIDKRELKCACVGGDSNVPLGAISLSENVFMVVAGALMLVMA